MSMSVLTRRARSFSLLAALMGSVFCLPAFAASVPSTGWVTTKVEGGDVPYCAVSRKIDSVVLTIGRTVADESSLAVQFATDELDPKKTYKVTLKPGKADAIEIESRPLNARTFVFNLDHVVDLKQEFAAVPTLDLTYGGTQNRLTLGEWSNAARDVEICLEAVRGTPVKTTDTAQGKKPETISPASLPKEKDKVAAAEIAQPVDKPAPKSVPVPQVKNPPVVPVPSVPVTAVPLPAPDASVTKKSPAATDLVAMAARSERFELERDLRRAQGELQDARSELDGLRAARLKDMQAAMDQTSRMQEQAQKITTLEAENKLLSAQLTADKKALMSDLAAEQKKDEAKGAAVEDTLIRQVADLEAKNERLVHELAEIQSSIAVAQSKDSQKTAADLAEKEKIYHEAMKEKADLSARVSVLVSELTQVQKMRAEHAALQVERDTLRMKLDDAIKASVNNPALEGKVKELETALAKRDTENKSLAQKLSTMDGETKDLKSGDLRARLDALASENVRLKADLAAMKASPDDMRVAVAAERPLRIQLRDLKKENDILMARSRELEDQIEKQRRGVEDKNIKSASVDEEMERALRRFEEAEREVQRLSLILREERAKCTADKREIEYMLFDPKIAKEGQVALLNSLEDQIAELKASQKSVSSPVACQTPAPASDLRFDEKERAEHAAVKAEMDKKIADLKIENEKLRADLAVAQNIADKMKLVAATVPSVLSAPAPLPMAKSETSSIPLKDQDRISWNGPALTGETAHAAAASRLQKLAAENAALKSDLDGVQEKIAKARSEHLAPDQKEVLWEKEQEEDADLSSQTPILDGTSDSLLSEDLLDADMEDDQESDLAYEPTLPIVEPVSEPPVKSNKPVNVPMPKSVSSSPLAAPPPVTVIDEMPAPVPLSSSGPRTVSVEPKPAPVGTESSLKEGGALPLTVADVGLAREMPKVPDQNISAVSTTPEGNKASASQPLEVAAALPSAPVVALPVPPPPPLPPPTQDVGQIALQTLMQKIGLQTVAPPVRLEKNPFGAGGAYRWETDIVVGLAAHRPGVSVSGFEGALSEILQKLKSVCTGDFAAQVASSHIGAPLTYTAYDVACIAGANSTSAAVLFYQVGSDFYMISHESAPDDMGKAMDIRDHLIRALGDQS